MKISVIRGAFLNPFELQNYSPLKEDFEIEAVSSKFPISSKVDLPVRKLWSPTDLPNFPYKYQILNRLFVDAQKLFGLEHELVGTQIAHVAETYFGYTHQAILAKKRGIIRKVVSTVWETIPHNNEGIGGRKEYKELAYEAVDHFIAVTNKAKNALIKEGVDPEKISVINMGVDIERFKPKKQKETSNHINILCVARLTPEKGINDLVKAFIKIRESNPKIWLTLVGDGPLKKDLVGYKNIIVKRVPYQKIHTEYQKADIFCLPSRSTKTWEEQYGMCLVEAMASGLPIVTTDTGAIPEVCGQAALYSPQRSSDSLKKNLEYLIYNQNIREKMGQEARKRAEKHFDHRLTAQQIKRVYQLLKIVF